MIKNKKMKKINSLLTTLLLTASVFVTQQATAQAPQKMSYQSVLRNSSNVLLANKQVGIKISVLQGTVSGNAVYIETQTPTTNANGLVSIQIGTGANQTGTFAGIDWSAGPYFIKTETDPLGGTTYTITGTQEILSVPYALNGITTAQANAITSQAAAITALQAKINSISALRPELNYPVGSVFCASGATQVVDVTNPTTGKTWMDRNLGATQVATSSTDAEAYGDLYQWGRGSDGHQCRNTATTSTKSSTDQPGNGNFITTSNRPLEDDWRTPKNDNLWQGINGINNPCPSGYRLPTEAELNAERLSWTSNDGSGAFASPINLPLAGIRGFVRGILSGADTIGRYWSSTINPAVRYLTFDSSTAQMNSNARSMGITVRCIKN